MIAPLVTEPFHGKDAIRPVVKALLQVVDKFDFQEMMEGPDHVSEYFRVTVGSEQLDGMDYWRLNEAGLIQEMTEQAGCITLLVTRFSRAALINLSSQQVIGSPEDADITKISKTHRNHPHENLSSWSAALHGA